MDAVVQTCLRMRLQQKVRKDSVSIHNAQVAPDQQRQLLRKETLLKFNSVDASRKLSARSKKNMIRQGKCQKTLPPKHGSTEASKSNHLLAEDDPLVHDGGVHHDT